jgi:hypothetical protein
VSFVTIFAIQNELKVFSPEQNNIAAFSFSPETFKVISLSQSYLTFCSF